MRLQLLRLARRFDDCRDDEIFERGVALLRLAEQLERAKAGQVRDLRCRLTASGLEFLVDCAGDPSLAMWSAAQEAPHLERVFGLRSSWKAPPSRRPSLPPA